MVDVAFLENKKLKSDRFLILTFSIQHCTIFISIKNKIRNDYKNSDKHRQSACERKDSMASIAIKTAIIAAIVTYVTYGKPHFHFQILLFYPSHFTNL